MKIALDKYLAGHEVSAEIRANAEELLGRVDVLLECAQDDKILLCVNSKTESLISGSGSGGYRTPDNPVGAKSSRHKKGQAVDIYDPMRDLAQWCIDNENVLEQCGLWMEDPRWTPTWVHLQSEPPGSGHRYFIPSNDSPLAPALKRRK